jgi:hypothetical protein
MCMSCYRDLLILGTTDASSTAYRSQLKPVFVVGHLLNTSQQPDLPYTQHAMREIRCAKVLHCHPEGKAKKEHVL